MPVIGQLSIILSPNQLTQNTLVSITIGHTAITAGVTLYTKQTDYIIPPLLMRPPDIHLFIISIYGRIKGV